ncbi:hypothetical protein [Streptomyces platensis]|uniref:hypothetical protein n=1 Tax=Streptomyces platensis TaxID=58346 RepID=UPI00368A5898
MDASSTIALIALVISIPTAVTTFAYSHRQTAAATRGNALTERAHREQAEPYVIADIRPRVPGSSLMVFSIENIGSTLARDVQLTIDPPLRTTQGEERDAVLNRAVARKIPTLPPKRTLLFNLDVGFNFFDSDVPLLYTVTVDAHGPFGKVDTLTYVIDLEVQRNTGLDRESLEWSTHVMAEEAKKSTKAQEEQASAAKFLAEQVRKGLDSRGTSNTEPPRLDPSLE